MPSFLKTKQKSLQPFSQFHLFVREVLKIAKALVMHNAGSDMHIFLMKYVYQGLDACPVNYTEFYPHRKKNPMSYQNIILNYSTKYTILMPYIFEYSKKEHITTDYVFTA